MAGFKMNPNFEREFARQLNAQLQKVFDSVYSRRAGQAVGEVKAALARILRGRWREWVLMLSWVAG
ncbi:hypothetical protein [Mycobacterium sp. ENV421]|uniref:hypothetical protein n=1 Tax=Mycobacterium sp. ENV421 TaxID=1213407 RepID=UPI001E645E74|nr:hypothetical protein [Mycobacterium sp. ENV421]